MRLVLAPMEGLADDVLRAVLTSAGGYDWCVTEFVRVTTTLLPHSCFTRLSPELKNGSRTASGTPVRIQLLGSDPALLAANAAHLARLDPHGIDLNFGCRTLLVNRNRGGAAVRANVPAAIPVTAKMRLGIEDTGCALDCALALETGGVQELVVHARTKADGYRPLVRWEWITRIREGREEVRTEADWREVESMVGEFWTRVQAKVTPTQSPGRLKQWLGMMCACGSLHRNSTARSY